MSFSVSKQMSDEYILKTPVILDGIGFHSGKRNVIIVEDNIENDGLYVVQEGKRYKIDPFAVSTEQRTTSIVEGDQIIAMTIEHLLSALHALNIRNLNIVFEEGNEVPILDGSAEGYMQLIESEIELIRREVDVLEVTETVRQVAQGDSSRFVQIEPSDSDVMTIQSTVSYPDSRILKQEYIFKFSCLEDYRREIANARTSFPFTIESEEVIEETKSRLKGAIFTGENKNVNIYSSWNTDKTRHENEVARHKILDFLGDLNVLNIELSPRITIKLFRTGHAINNALARRIATSLLKNGNS
ncbi:hypothetical protein HN512_04790 [Candidatus Peregrinibacteria bacterium]|jgi:UDP-3-O-[3-hydroxymyristoyl] N-acetylglucosamine deacetylase|nr:hypothetical protein [Candidatus Peregrinibacteria bacterium]MBT3599122.1 hypothetical protein [Candidatus Peregrinibacteria bacterium]MBT4367510.1 hypothetical protein [Candidatus Peregrinibacteria bacterium]MBT4585978.1 hypothetical protein [Candidatus Peregrinibacteria bacterium]MBT6730762.1 hypothetical protein [Candidatus Peregrinibacteria bacterium]